MRLSPKRPDSIEQFSWDCRTTILSGKGGTISSIVGVYEEEDDGANTPSSSVTILSTPTPDVTGFIISAMLGGGTVGKTHKMTAEFLTTQGERLFHTIAFDCKAVVVG
jgi:hypothetical protein